MKWERLCEIGRELPEVEEGISYRTPALKVRGKTFARLKEDGQSVVFFLQSIDEQEYLLQTQSDVYFITDHYRGWPGILARLSALRVAECRSRLAQGWRLKAPASLLNESKRPRTAER